MTKRVRANACRHIWAVALLLCSASLSYLPLSAQAPAVPDTVTGALTGTVRGRFGTGVRRLEHAVIQVISASGRYGVAADSVGVYTLRDIPPGELRLRATHPGHTPIEVTVWLPANRTVRLDLELTADPLELPRVQVTADRPGNSDPQPSGTRASPNPALEVELLEAAPGVSEVGLVEAVQALPGNDPSDPSDVLFMRGSTTDLKLVLLDGVPVVTPFHVAGLMRSFDPTVLNDARLHLGGAPARYDGGLTHILELRTRSARRDRVRASGSLDLLAASVAAEVPLGAQAGFVASARSLHDLGQTPLGGERPYGYRDVLISVDADPSPSHRLRATGFWNTESIRLDFAPSSSDAWWSNQAASVGYTGTVGSTRFEFSAGASTYRAELPLQPAQRPGEPPPDAILASAERDRMRALGEVVWGPAHAPIRAGLSFEDHQVGFAARSLGEGAQAERRGSGSVLGAFLDTTRPVGRGVTLRAGLRGDLFSGTDARLSPRASLLWELAPTATLSVAGGRYHQATRSPVSEVDAVLSDFANLDLTETELMPVAAADHLVLSLNQRVGRSVSLGIQGFWKRYTGLRGGSQDAVLNSGLDLRVSNVGEEGSAWLGYGLSWFWSPVDLSGRATDFVGRHLLSTGVSGRISGPIRGEARLAYGAGLPSTSIPFGSAFRGEAQSDATPGPTEPTVSSGDDVHGLLDELRTDDAFLRIDLEINAVFEPEWGGHHWRVRPYLRVLNALDRRDPLFYTYQPWRSDSVTPLAERPLLPVLGISFSF
jgi:hypothetical protein